MLTDRDIDPKTESGIKCSQAQEKSSTSTRDDELALSESRSSKQVSPMCEVCTTVPSKYTCPGCGVKTCCLLCVKVHKVKLGCNGERNKFAFVDKSDYSDQHLLNDYRFLEFAERSVYSNKTVPRNRHVSHHLPPYYHHQSKRARILISAAGKRGVRLWMMPNSLSKHKTNSSFYTISSDVIDWFIEWQFVSSSCLVKDSKVPETTILLDASQKFLNAVDYPHLRKALEDYRKRLHVCHFLIKVEGLPANRKRFLKLKPEWTLGDNLKGLNLVEHPTIFVLPPGYSQDDFRLLDKDNDLTHMMSGHLKHLTSHHPDFSQTDHLENQLLDLTSNVYKTDDETQ